MSAHDVVREARIIHALGPTDVPVPVVHGIRRDTKSVPWVLLEHVDGQVIDTMDGGRQVLPGLRRTIGTSMAETLAQVHALNVEEIGLGDLASRSPYAARQLRRWTNQWEASRTRSLPELDGLSRRLTAAMPEQDEFCLVHGDFHVRNVIVHDGQVAAVLDWELSTIGDPLADVGTLLAYWPQAGELEVADRSAVSTLPGYPTRSDLLTDYAAASGRDVSAVAFWHVLGIWKIAIITEGILRRATEQPGSQSLGEPPSTNDIDQLIAYASQIADDTAL